MEEPTNVQVFDQARIADLPGQVQFHFASALLAEMEGNTVLAETELNLAIEAERSLFLSQEKANAALMKYLEA
jgi:hypothetical protein